MSSRFALVVDDHASFRRVARRMLEAEGFDVAEAATGTDAVAASRAASYDLVLLDVQLPDFDGFDVADRLAYANPRPLVILTSSRTAADYGPRIAASPVTRFVPKSDLSSRLLRSIVAEAR
jgi:CheY-like chemotaxis protein